MHSDYFERLGARAVTVAKLIDVVSLLPFGLHGDTLVGSEAFFQALRQATKIAVKGPELKALKDALAALINNFRETKEPGRQLVNLLVIEMHRALKNDRDNPPALALDATLGDAARWLTGDYKASSFTLAAALNHALQDQGELLEEILGEKPVGLLQSIAASLPADLGGRCYGSPKHNKRELIRALRHSNNASGARAKLVEAALMVGRDPDNWETLIRNAMVAIRLREWESKLPVVEHNPDGSPKKPVAGAQWKAAKEERGMFKASNRREAQIRKELAAVPAEIKTACSMVFNVLQGF